MRSDRNRVLQLRSTGSGVHGRLLPVVDAALRRVLGSKDQEYEDLLQSSLEAVLVATRKERFRGDSLQSTWASRIARNVAIDALRARARERRVFAFEADMEDVAARSHSNEPSPEKAADVRQQLARYHDTLGRLCEKKAQVVYLYDVLGHGLEEIASTLGITVAATQSRLVRGRKEISNVVASLERRDVDPHGVEERAPPSGVRWRVPRAKEARLESDVPPKSSGAPRRTLYPAGAR
jgi:RNA polymerase sigma factor (sigma-70 family)